MLDPLIFSLLRVFHSPINTIEDVGTKQYQDYMQTVIKDCTQSIHAPIKRNGLPLMKNPEAKPSSKKDQKAKQLKNNVSLFS